MKALGLLLVLIFLVACAKTEIRTTQPALPGSDAAPRDAIVPKPAEPPKDIALEPGDIRCDLDKRSLTFAFRNNDTKDWQMNQEVPFSAPSNLAAVRVYVNNYEVNGRTPYLVNGERMFGPKERFSDNCGGVEVLKPGDVATCTIYPVPINTGTQLAVAKNAIYVNSPTNKNILPFNCT